ncbi:polysaccharide deacetylase family protein [Granulimonas faecalis]|nr:polysaccharide deacetylase family protein [Granulimonas faecalis]
MKHSKDNDRRVASHMARKASRRSDAPAPAHAASAGQGKATHPAGAAAGKAQAAAASEPVTRPAAENPYIPPAEASAGAQTGYRAPEPNPVLSSDAPIGHTDLGFKPVREQPGSGRRRLDPKKRNRAILVIVLVFALIGAMALVSWLNRSVTFSLNGSDATVKVGTTIKQLMADKGLSYTPGDMLSVKGEVLKQGEGNPFSAKVGDSDLSVDDARAYRIQGGETIELGDGTDTTEPYTTQVQEEQPKLVMDGTWGAVSYVSQWGQVGKVEMRTGSISGETAQGDVIQEVQNCVITVRNVEPKDGEKLVALTFDDGPSEYTQKYLDILKQYDAKATFFNLGENIANYPDQAKAIVDAGCQLASHTQTHQQLPTLGAEKLQSELKATFDEIEKATGVKTTVIRPPYGDFKERTWLESGGLMSLSVLWNQDSLDWKRPGASTIVDNSLVNITPGSIILMHDGGGNRDQDVEALPTIIQRLQADGYKLVTVDELLASDPNVPEDIATGDATVPEGCVWPTELGDA